MQSLPLHCVWAHNSHHIQLTRHLYIAIQAMEVFLLIYNLNKVRVKPAVVAEAEWSFNGKYLIKDQVVLTQLCLYFSGLERQLKKFLLLFDKNYHKTELVRSVHQFCFLLSLSKISSFLHWPFLCHTRMLPISCNDFGCTCIINRQSPNFLSLTKNLFQLLAYKYDHF